MDMAELERIAQRGLGGEFRLNEPMRKHTSWRTGGCADRAYFPRDLEDFVRFVRTIPADEPVHVVGLGSNLLVRDGGLRGTVVFLHGGLNQVHLEIVPTGERLIYAEAGVASPKVARFAATHNLVGAEFLAGIPGTVGGAVTMNAGCYGAEAWDITAAVLCVQRDGKLVRRTVSDFEIGYRHVVRREQVQDSEGPAVAPSNGGAVAPTAVTRSAQTTNEWFAAAWFRLVPGDGESSRHTIKELLQRRIATQPLDKPKAGSVFRNPPGDYAARLIEACGLKSFALGGAMVSPKHANFIINTGCATAADIETLIATVQQKVWEKFSVMLEREVRIIGERA
jgi:UDP-N-acetylmuramate dehydrogenase